MGFGNISKFSKKIKKKSEFLLLPAAMPKERRLPVCSEPVTEEERGTYFEKAILIVQHGSDMLQKVAAFNTTLAGRGAPTAFQRTGQSNPLIALET
jgi:hypothetical protein